MKAGWRAVPLGEICLKVTQGPNPKYDGITNPAFGVLKTKDVYDDVIHYGKADRVSQEVFADHPSARLQAGDVLLAIVGQGSINKCNVFQPQQGTEFIFTRALGLLRPSPKALDPFFLRYFLQSSTGKASVDAGIGGTSGQQVVTTTHLKSLLIPLPLLDEQKRIVAVLDEAFEGLSRARANAEANLVDARELLDTETDRLLLADREGWKSCLLEDVISRFEYGTSTKSEGSGSVPVLRMGNLQNGEVNWADLVYTSDVSEINRLALRDGDVLFNRTNSVEHVGKAAIVRGARNAIFAGYLVRLHCNSELLDPEFLTLFLNCRPTREHGRSVAGKSVNQANISAGKLKTYPMRLPPLQEQKEIAARILNLRRAVNEVAETERGKLRLLDTLRQSLLQRAFSGELT